MILLIVSSLEVKFQHEYEKTVKDNKKKILIMSDIHVRRIDRKKLQN